MLLVTSTCRSISGDEITWHSFCAVSIMAQGGDSNERWTLKWTRLLCRSLGAGLNLKSGFLQIGLLLKWLLWIFFPAQIVSGCREWLECDCWIYVFKLKHFVRHDYPYYYDKFDDRILRIPGAEFCHSFAHVCLQTSNLASFTVQTLLQFFWVWCQKWLRVKRDNIVCWKTKRKIKNDLKLRRSRMLSYKGRSKKRNFDWAALFSGQITAAKW